MYFVMYILYICNIVSLICGLPFHLLMISWWREVLNVTVVQFVIFSFKCSICVLRFFFIQDHDYFFNIYCFNFHILLIIHNDFIFVIGCKTAGKIYFSLDKHLLAQLHLLIKPGFPHCIAVWPFLYVRWFYLHGRSLDCFIHWSVFISLII